MMSAQHSQQSCIKARFVVSWGLRSQREREKEIVIKKKN